MNLHEFLVFGRAEMIVPIGVSFGMRGAAADLFLLEVIGDKDSPIRCDGQMVAFNDRHLCQASIERLNPLLCPGVKVEHKFDFVCSVPGAINLVMEQESDRDAVVLNCINTLLDLVATSRFDLPEDYRILRALADRLTFREEFGEFKQTRALTRNALLWCAGAAIVDMRLIQSLAEFDSILPNLSAVVSK